MKIKVLVGILIFLIVVNMATIGSYVYFQMKPRPLPHFAPPLNRRPPIDLEPQQRHQLGKLLLDLRSETKLLQRQVFQLEEEVFELLQSNASPETVRHKLEKMSHIRLELSKMAVEKMRNAKAFLSPEQQRRFYYSLLHGRPGMSRERPPFLEGRPPFLDHRPPRPF